MNSFLTPDETDQACNNVAQYVRSMFRGPDRSGPKRTFQLDWPKTEAFPEGQPIDVDAVIAKAEATGVYDEAYGQAWILRQMFDRGYLDQHEVKEPNGPT